MKRHAEVVRILRDVKDPLAVLKLLGGYYECPKEAGGRRLGPLVGYAGRDKDGMQFVGDSYVNFAVAEEWPAVLDEWAWQFRGGGLARASVFCGAPMGGIAFAYALAKLHVVRFVYPEKKTIEVATATAREKSELVFARHSIESGDRVVIVEDVLNNFSTTGQMISLIESAGGEVVAIAGLLNRSLTIEDEFIWQEKPFSVFALVRKQIPEWRQIDPAVRGDVAKGNVVWKPKNEWSRLMESMAAAEK